MDVYGFLLHNGPNQVSTVRATDYRCEYMSKKVIVEMDQYFKWIESFTTYEKRIEINLMPVTLSQLNQFHWIVCKTFASTNFHLFALLCHFGLH